MFIDTYFFGYISNIKNIDDLINKSELLKEHEYILKEIVEESKYLLTNREEKKLQV